MKNPFFAFIFSLLIVVTNIKAQNFDYQFSTSSGTYTEINAPFYLAQKGSWISSSKIPIGFPFYYMGEKSDWLTVTSDGYIAFEDLDYKFSCFGLNLSMQRNSIVDSLSSSISYLVIGEPGNRILTVQYKNCGVSNESSGYVNFQVKLFEGSNKIVLAVGERTIDVETLNNYTKKVGLIKTGNQNALMIMGNANAPTTSNLNGNDQKISGFPNTNSTYVFTPNF